MKKTIFTAFAILLGSISTLTAQVKLQTNNIDVSSGLKNIPKIVDLIRYDILVEAKSEGNRENADNMTFIMIEI